MPIKELKLNLAPLIRKLEIFTRKKIETGLTGKYVSAFKGRGLEFEGYGQYTPADDATLIDWKASLRADEILIKKFMQERNITVFFLMDTSNSMLFASINKLKAEYAAEMVASLSFAILQAGDNVGIAMFTDRIEKTVKPNMGNRQFFEIIRAVSNPQFYGGDFDLTFALKYIISFLKRRSVLIIVSDFLGLKGDWKKYMRIATEKYEVITLIVRDQRDKTLPVDVGQIVIEDPYSDEQRIINPTLAAKQYAKIALEQEKKLMNELKECNIDFIELVTNKSFVGEVTKFFARREHRV
jgi:uncharacterized protein (DUF58 family)